MRKIKIADRLIGIGEPCFIIAEAGVNHNGDIRLAMRLIDAAKKAGADAVKFQAFKAEEEVTKYARKADYQALATGKKESQFEMLKKLELGKDDFRQIFNYAKNKGILFLSTGEDRENVDLLCSLGIAGFKIGSGEITNFPLLKYIAAKSKPIILSTGMATIKEIKEGLGVIQEQGLKEVILLHCISAYPSKIEEMNLKAMDTLRNIFKLPVGLSDHSPGISIPLAAAARESCIIEKHFTLDKSLPGPDHKFSLEPQELTEMVNAVRKIERALGNGIKRPTKEELKIKDLVRRSVVARVDIAEGAVINEGMLAVKRPGTGIAPKYVDKIIGRKAKRKIEKDKIITRDIVK